MSILQIPAEIVQTSSELSTKGSIYWHKFLDMAIAYAPKVIGAIIIYLIGKFIINKFIHVTEKVFKRKNFDISLLKFLVSLISVTLNILMFLAIAGILGVNITSFAAILAGAGLAIGAALNGSLGNLAGGVMMMIFKPIKVGDLIEAQSVIGVVHEIGIFNTTLLSSENKTIFLPNGALSTGTIINYSTQGFLRVDLSIAIAMDADVELARSVAVKAMQSMPEVLQNPAPNVAVLKVGDGMVTLAIRPYANQADYWTVYFGVQEVVKKAFDANNIKAPIPARVIFNS